MYFFAASTQHSSRPPPPALPAAAVMTVAPSRLLPSFLLRRGRTLFFFFLSLLLLLLTRRAEEEGGGAALPGVKATDALEVALLGDHLCGAAVAAKPPRRLREAAIAGRVCGCGRGELSLSLFSVSERYYYFLTQ